MATRRLNGPSLRALREAYRIPQGDLAARLGLSQGYLSNLEKGVKQPSPVTLHRIANALGVSIEAVSFVIPDADEAVDEVDEVGEADDLEDEMALSGAGSGVADA